MWLQMLKIYQPLMISNPQGNRSSLFKRRIANPPERLTDSRISLTPSGLANLYYGLMTQHLE